MKAIFAHTIRFYDTLEGMAVEEDGLKVFKGHPTSVVTEEMGLPIPYYGQMRSALITLECIKQIKRGSGKSQSVWVLVRRPEPHDFDNVDPENGSTKLDQHAFRLYQISTDAAIENIESRLGGLNVVQALAELQEQINDLRKQLQQGES